MAPLSANDVISHGLALPFSERMSVANELLASVKPPGIMSIDDPGLAQELDRRTEEIRSGKVVPLDGQMAMKRLREQLSTENP